MRLVLARIVRFADRSGAMVAAVLSALLSVPCIAAPLFTDDVLHRLVLDGADLGLATRPMELYAFVARDAARVTSLIELGRLPWWTSPELALDFQRPLSSASLALDHWIAPWNAPLAHVHSLLWTIALVLAVSRLHRRLVPSAASLATFVYALATAFAFTSGWIAARHTLLTATFSALAIERWLAAESDGRARDEGLAAGFLALALASGEGAVGAPLFYGVLVLAAPLSWATRARRLAAPLGVLVAYLALYASVGGGARGSGGYLDPIGAPLETSAQIVLRGLAFVTDCYLGLPCDAAHGPALVPFAMLGALVLAMALLAVRSEPPPERRRLLTLLVAGIAASLPGTLGFFGGRVLLIALFGSSAFVASLLHRAEKSEPPRALRLFANVSAVCLLVFAPIVRLGGGVALTAMSFESREAARRSREVCAPGEPILILDASDPSVAIYTPIYWLADDPTLEAEIRLLAMSPHAIELERTGERSLRLTALEGALLTADWERLYRREIPATLEVALPTATVRFSAADDTIDYEDPSDAHWASTCFLQWDGRALVRTTLPPVGERVTIDWAPGPMGM